MPECPNCPSPHRNLVCTDCGATVEVDHRDYQGTGDFSIGSSFWPGISKLLEEAGEVIQVGGKLLGTAGQLDHWDGTNLKERLEDELADLQAAIEFVACHNDLDDQRMRERIDRKIELFNEWHQGKDRLPQKE